jgi:hypothetical protein
VDTDGNEYVYLDYQEAVVGGEFVSFDSAFAAVQLTSTALGWVGIVMKSASASDHFGWAMVRGVHDTALVSSGSSVGPVIATVTTDIGNISTAPAGTAGVAVFGIALTESPDTCASTGVTGGAGTSLSGLATVYLNYPFINGAAIAATS